MESVINYFNRYPLYTAKRKSFYIWIECYNLMLLKKHLTPDGALELIKFRRPNHLWWVATDFLLIFFIYFF